MDIIESILKDKKFAANKTKEQLKEIKQFADDGEEKPITVKNGKAHLPRR